MPRTHPLAARIAMRSIGGLAALIAILNIIFAVRVGSGIALVFGAVNSLAYGWAGIGLWRMRESAWIVVMLILAMTASAELAVFAATRDMMVGIVAAINTGFIAALIWAGRQLDETSETPGEPLEGPAA